MRDSHLPAIIRTASPDLHIEPRRRSSRDMDPGALSLSPALSGISPHSGTRAEAAPHQAPVAQRIEQAPSKRLAVGSSPTGGATCHQHKRPEGILPRGVLRSRRHRRRHRLRPLAGRRLRPARGDPSPRRAGTDAHGPGHIRRAAPHDGAGGGALGPDRCTARMCRTSRNRVPVAPGRTRRRSASAHMTGSGTAAPDGMSWARSAQALHRPAGGPDKPPKIPRSGQRPAGEGPAAHRPAGRTGSAGAVAGRRPGRVPYDTEGTRCCLFPASLDISSPPRRRAAPSGLFRTRYRCHSVTSAHWSSGSPTSAPGSAPPPCRGCSVQMIFPVAVYRVPQRSAYRATRNRPRPPSSVMAA